jgi:hypothetical protein
MGTGLTSCFRADAWRCRPVSSYSGHVTLASGDVLLSFRQYLAAGGGSAASSDHLADGRQGEPRQELAQGSVHERWSGPRTGRLVC